MADRGRLIQASQILEQKLIEFNTFMGLDPYDGVQPYSVDYHENAYLGQTAQVSVMLFCVQYSQWSEPIFCQK